ncbi:hypothetical protein C0995_006893 [Termitomyces sp. Mi166|nr:hypothetical protein C0995_006893 [Termitomyces sp. Mi166\
MQDPIGLDIEPYEMGATVEAYTVEDVLLYANGIDWDATLEQGHSLERGWQEYEAFPGTLEEIMALSSRSLHPATTIGT